MNEQGHYLSDCRIMAKPMKPFSVTANGTFEMSIGTDNKDLRIDVALGLYSLIGRTSYRKIVKPCSREIRV